MKHSELEDGDQLVTRIELREVMVAIHEEILSIHETTLSIHKDISDLRETIRNKWWIPVVVTLIVMIGNTIVAILFHKYG